MGGTGVFVSALRDALLRGDVDLAVHSLKDLPTTPHDGDRPGRRTRPGGSARRRRGPRRAHAGRAPGRCAHRHGVPATGRTAARARSRFRRGGNPWQRGHPDQEGVRRRGGRRRPGPSRHRPARTDGRGDRGARPVADAPRPRAGCARGRVPGRRRGPGRPGPETRSTTRARGPPSSRSGRCWPRWRRDARRRSGRWRRSPRATTATSCGCGPWRCRADGAVAVRRSATGLPEDAEKVGRGLAEEMLDDGASTLIEEQTA